MKICPTCKKPIKEPFSDQDQQWLPFCCERCKLIDFGAWLDGSHAIPGDEVIIIPDGQDDNMTPH